MSVGQTAADAVSAASAWLWANWGQQVVKKVLDAATKEAKKALEERWERVRWDEAALRYRERMHTLYGNVRILGSPRPAPLEDLFTDLWILDRPTALQRYDIEQLREDPSSLKKPKRISGLRMVTGPEGRRLYILGKPGAGKTTFLKYLALQAVQDKLDALPILVVLREWVDSGQDLLPFIARQFEICGFPDALPFIEHVLEQGRALVLLDGLDEVNREGGQRQQAIAALRDFSRQYLESQCLITCRVAATDYQFEQYTYVELADFTDEQMQVYARKWFSDEPTKRDHFIQELAREENRGLRELGRTPLLLSMLCLAFDETMRFPQRRVEIYEEALNALLSKWDASRSIQRDEVYQRLSLGRKRQMLARIAASTFEASEVFMREAELVREIETYLGNLPPSDAEAEVDGAAVLRAIEAQHSILIERARGIHSFAHLTFHEYYTARYVADNEARGTVERLIDSHLAEDRWRVVLELTASMLDDANHFFERFADALDALVRREPVVAALLRAVEERVAAREGEALEPAAMRSLVLYYAPALANAPAHYTTRNRDRTRERNLDRARVLARALALALAPGLATVRTRPRPRARDLARALALALNRTAVQLLADYLSACRLYVDCLEVAYVSDRAGLQDRLLRVPKT